MSFISVPTWPSKQSPGEGSLSRGYATLFFRSTSFRHPHPKHVSESSSHPVLTFSAAVVSLGGFSWGAPARLGSSFGILSRKVARRLFKGKSEVKSQSVSAGEVCSYFDEDWGL